MRWFDSAVVEMWLWVRNNITIYAILELGSSVVTICDVITHFNYAIKINVQNHFIVWHYVKLNWNLNRSILNNKRDLCIIA
jgi:hypothetical protein